MPRPPRKLPDQVRDRMRRKHSSLRTEEAYAHWITHSILATTSATRSRWVLRRLKRSSHTWPWKRRWQPHPESGPIVQELLGHKDVKATVIYPRLLDVVF